jgi:release factor glutamine methyltransferase
VTDGPRFVPGMTLAQARRVLAQCLRAGGIESADIDARVLCAHALGRSQTALIAAADETLDAVRDIAALETVLARRLAREPVARVVGRKEFWSLDFDVGPATLVPRPETETIVAMAIEAFDRAAPLRIADLGTGSGALVLALLSEWPNATAVATDIDPQALTMARGTARRLGLADRVVFVACDYAQALRGPFDLVVSNPPYIPRDDIVGLDTDVRGYDPLRALDGGADGLDAYRAIAASVAPLLCDRARLIVELGIGQADAVAAIFAAQGLACDAVRPDIAGIPRALSAAVKKPAGSAVPGTRQKGSRGQKSTWNQPPERLRSSYANGPK